MSDFQLDMRDVRFNLFDFLDIGELAKTERYADFDAELFSDVMDAAADQAINLLAPRNEEGDRVGLKMVDGRVIMPEGWRQVYETFVQAGWNGLSVKPKDGGQGLPGILSAATQDLFIQANCSFLFTPGLTAGAISLVTEWGTADQKAIYLDKMISGEWSGTMCLTEANAGTAVPDLKSTATPIPGREGFFHIKGTKIFISAGDHDLTDNIVHMVLARVGDDEGVSLFVVPRLRPDGSGGLTYNDVTTVGIEHKLGIHASPTCSLSFGDEGDSEGWLLGEQGRGLKCMFVMMNHARIAVGLQGVGLSNAAYLKSLAYAKERVQGTRIQDMRKKDAERVTIIHHPDVRRNLMQMKTIAEGTRALCYYAAYCSDRMETAEDDKAEKHWHHLLEIMTPIVKAWSSDEGFKAAEIGIQVHGGYGYIAEYGMEQIMRDAKIGSLYEGTNGVQALDLLGRKISRGGGIMLMTTLNEINKFLNGPAKSGGFESEIAALGKARDAIAKVAMGFAQRSLKGDIEYSAMHATPFLQMFGDLVVGWLLTRQAVRAEKLYQARLQSRETEGLNEELGQVLEEDAEARYLHGKMASARFFVHQTLPRVQARLASINSEDRTALTVVL